MDSQNLDFKEFKLTNDGIHLLRNGFNYKTISFQNLDKAVIKKDVETKHVFLTISVGVLLFAFAILQTIGVYESFNDPEVFKIYIESIVIPVLPGLIGLYCIYISIKKVPSLILNEGTKKYKLSIIDTIKTERYQSMISFLKNHLHTKLVIEDSFKLISNKYI